MDCSKLTAGLLAKECNKSATAGVEDDIILFEFNDVDKSLSNVTKDNVIDNITLTSNAKRGYKFITFGKSLDEAGATFVKGTYRNTWQHSLPLKIFVKSEEVKNFVNTFATGAKVIAIVKNKEGGPDGEVTYEAYGWDNGLEVTESASTAAMTDGVVYTLTLGTPEAAQEGTLPKSVFMHWTANPEEPTHTQLKETEKRLQELIGENA